MWDKRKLLLPAIIFSALCYKVSAEGEKLLGMAEDAVDDQFDGCRIKAWEKFIDSDLLTQEQNRSKGFKKAWDAKTCLKFIPGKLKEHTAALLAYVNGDESFIKTFNKAVKTLGVNVSTYENDFHFKSLHFLLMDSMTRPKQCKTVYAVSNEKYTTTNESKIRFGGFTKAKTSYSDLEKEQDLSDGPVIFNITSCFFATLGPSICGEDDEVLLSPAEVFTLEEVKNVRDEDNDSEYTVIVLKHSKLESLHNCYLWSRAPADVSTQWLVSVLVAVSLFFLNC